MENLKALNLDTLDDQELRKTDGGFIALTILGVTYTAAQVATAAGALFIAGVGAGVAAAAATD